MKNIILSLITTVIAINWSCAQTNTAWSTTGNIGIGTTTPGYLLDVNGNMRAGAYAEGQGIFGNDNSGHTLFSFTRHVNDLNISAFSSIGFAVNQTSGFTNYSMYINAGGNVGIGITSPQSPFHVSTTGVSVDGGNNYEYCSQCVIVQANTGSRSATTGAELEFVVPANTDGTNPWGQGRIITVAGNANSSDATGMMILGTRRMFNKLGTGSQWYYGNDIVIDGSGNVGIGTTTTHGYNLAVNGTMHTKSVTVDLTNWPDYVFTPSYKFRPLSEVKAFINLNHHLPDMPSAEDVEKNGLNLGETDKLLTKKVEELTLYLIDKDTENKELQSELNDQQQQISNQQKIIESQALINQSLQKKLDELAQRISTLEKTNK